MPPVGALVVATWRDAYFDFDYEAPRDDYLVRTVGFVVENDSNKFLSLAQEELPGEDGWRAVTHVPLPLVTDWKELSP
jgi:hypothetical protein